MPVFALMFKCRGKKNWNEKGMKCTVWMRCKKTRETNRTLIICNKRNIEIHANYAGSSRQIKTKNRVATKSASHFRFLLLCVRLFWPIKKNQMEWRRYRERKKGSQKETEEWNGNERKHLNVGKSQHEKRRRKKINGNENAQEWMRCIGKSATRMKCYVCQRMLFGLKRIKLRPFRARKTNDSGKTTLKPKEKKSKE